MNIKQKQSSNLKLIAILLGVFVLAFAGGFAFAWQQKASVSTKSAVKDSLQSMFVFDAPSGWRQGPSNEVSMAAFSTAQPDGTSSCFMSAEYYDIAIKETDAVKKNEEDIAQGGNTVTAIGAQTLAINTPEGKKQYTLHQYKIVSSGQDALMGGHSIAFVPHKTGHLKIYANCNTVEELPITIPALEAYRIQRG